MNIAGLPRLKLNSIDFGVIPSINLNWLRIFVASAGMNTRAVGMVNPKKENVRHGEHSFHGSSFHGSSFHVCRQHHFGLLWAPALDVAILRALFHRRSIPF